MELIKRFDSFDDVIELLNVKQHYNLAINLTVINDSCHYSIATGTNVTHEDVYCCIVDTDNRVSEDMVREFLKQKRGSDVHELLLISMNSNFEWDAVVFAETFRITCDKKIKLVSNYELQQISYYYPETSLNVDMLSDAF